MSRQLHTLTSGSTLDAYLNDHLAGSKAGVELVTRCRSENEGTALGETLGELAVEIEADREVLEDVMAKLGVEPSATKQAAGWVAEKASRARFVARGETTRRLMELETLSLGIEGKRLLWTALQEIADVDPRLDGIDFPGLAARAKTQRNSIEPFRRRAAVEGHAD